ncbi:MAG: FHA domain-containing protein [Chloroflexota bacterium]|nr:FHA domain-containing protein [Chloroflexota bacterium]
MLNAKLDLTIMSGVRDGTPLSLSNTVGHGIWENGVWVVRVGRNSDNDLPLNDDDFSSGYHAKLIQRLDGWWLQDCGSTNGTFIDNGIDDERMAKSAIAALEPGQLFRIGRTWMRIDPPQIDK